jgi:chromosomal replication initiator protein
MIAQQPSIETIMKIVAPTFGVTQLDIVSHRRNPSALLARRTAMWLARRLTKHSLSEIGRHFNRHHTSVIESVMRLDTLMDSNVGVGQLVAGLMDCLTLPPEAA